MRFYDVKVELEPQDVIKTITTCRDSQWQIVKQRFSDAYFMVNRASSKSVIFASNTIGDLRLAIICDNNTLSLKHLVKAFLDSAKQKYVKYDISEITIAEIMKCVEGTTIEPNAVKCELSIIGKDFESICGLNYNERLLSQNKKYVQIEKECKKYLCCSKYEEEIQRINSKKKMSKIVGHPVHYLISSADDEKRAIMVQNLVHLLYAKNRISTKRYVILRIADDFSEWELESMFKVNSFGVIVARLENSLWGEDGDVLTDDYGENIEKFCNVARKFRDKVLVIFSTSHDVVSVREKIKHCLLDVPLYEIIENSFALEWAKDYLNLLCERREVSSTPELFKALESAERNETYHICQLQEIFSDWYSNCYISKVYPEYSDYLQQAQQFVKKREIVERGNAFAKLQNLVGLSNVKTMIEKTLSYFKLQNELQKRGLITTRPSMHMIFTGNPGTAKTTVARLVAKIFRENDILGEGDIFELGRADLVGKYVGWTAQIVKDKFKKASGSVLFIDEAYSLVDDNGGSYGDEAINTIVQEMENHRDDVVVIFAGYKNKMQQFIDSNDGLKSRISFHIDFDDYNEDELCQIAQMIAKEKDRVIDEDAQQKLKSIFAFASKVENFGNGRFVRNIIEQAMFCQSDRLSRGKIFELSDSQLRTLEAQDFVFDTEQVGKINIGFAS